MSAVRSGLKTVKCVVVGDGAVGKTCLLMSYTQKMFPREYIPTIFDNYSSNVDYNGNHIRLDLYDTAGQEDYDRLRVICYSNTDVFLVCYSVVSTASLDNIKSKWISEIRQHCPNAPVVLVGLKMDLRDDEQKKIEMNASGYEYCSEKAIQEIAEEIDAATYIECSALKSKGVNKAFRTAIDVALKGSKTRKGTNSCCTVL